MVMMVAMGTAACGGGDGGDRLTAGELRTRANAVCTELQDDAQAAFADLLPDDEPTAYQGAIKKLVRVVDQAIERLDDLNPPKNQETRYDEALSAYRAAQDKVREAGETPEASAVVFAGAKDPYDDANAIFNELGLTSCGGGSATG